jgi:hypothetical protein
VEARGGFPATVKRTHTRTDPGLLRIDWDEWFKGFEDNNLAFLYEDEADNRFSKLISRT